MFQHVSHTLVGLGKCPCFLACLSTDLGGRLGTQLLKVRSELVVGHQHFLHCCCTTNAVSDVSQQCALAGLHFFEMLLQQGYIQLDDWVGVHPQRLVNHQQLSRWEAYLHLIEQRLG